MKIEISVNRILCRYGPSCDWTKSISVYECVLILTIRISQIKRFVRFIMGDDLTSGKHFTKPIVYLVTSSK